MGINAVGQTGATTSVAASAPRHAEKPSENASPAPAAKKDTATLSEKAKDLAALKAGKAFSEEAQESTSAKMKEAEE
jgi:hypothetical protein